MIGDREGLFILVVVNEMNVFASFFSFKATDPIASDSSCRAAGFGVVRSLGVDSAADSTPASAALLSVFLDRAALLGREAVDGVGDSAVEANGAASTGLALTFFLS